MKLWAAAILGGYSDIFLATKEKVLRANVIYIFFILENKAMGYFERVFPFKKT